MLNRLTSLKISTAFRPLEPAWIKNIPDLVSSSPLESFELYSAPLIQDVNGIQMDEFVAALISAHGQRLKRFSIDRLPISLKAFYDVCAGLPNLELLFVTVEREDLVSGYLRIRQAALQSIPGSYRELVIESHQTSSGPHKFFDHSKL